METIDRGLRRHFGKQTEDCNTLLSTTTTTNKTTGYGESENLSLTVLTIKRLLGGSGALSGDGQTEDNKREVERLLSLGHADIARQLPC